VIVSHRHWHYEDAVAECDRWVMPKSVVRRVFMKDMNQEERITLDALGRGTEDRSRARLMIVLTGELRATVLGRCRTLLPGAIVGTERVDQLLTHGGEGLTLSIDWKSEEPFHGGAHLGPRALQTLRALSASIRDHHPSDAELMGDMTVVHELLRAEGIDIATFLEPVAQSQPDDQRTMNALDTILSNLHRSPSAADWETLTGTSRRTFTRRTHSVHQEYNLFGLRRQTDWRSVRDFSRLLTSTLFLTHKNATVASVAKAVGYRSAAALCSAYAQARLPPPGKVRALAASG
jgi:AraC-like DNA-binding protein